MGKLKNLYQNSFKEKVLYRYILFFLLTIILLETYSLFAIGYYQKYTFYDNSFDEYIVVFFIYTILFFVSKGEKAYIIPVLFLFTYFLIDFVSSKYNRYLDFSDLKNIPLLFDALLQSKGEVVYLVFVIPVIFVYLFFKSKLVRRYFIGFMFVIVLMIYPNNPLTNSFVKIFEHFSYMTTNFWSPKKPVLDFAKTGRLSSFVYSGILKEQRHKLAKKYTTDMQKELNNLVHKIKKHIKKRDVYLIGLESFILPNELTKLKLVYLNHDSNKTYDVVSKSSRMITSIFGGGTIQSEFEVLCGVPALQQFSAFEFTEFTGSPTNCLPRILQSLDFMPIVSNTYKPQPSFEALKTVGFKKIFFPKEYFPDLPSYITNKAKAKDEYAISDDDFFTQNLNYIENNFIKQNKTVFNYLFSVWGHAFHDMDSTAHPKAIEVKNKDKLSISKSSIRALNQSYYRIKALQKFFDNIKKKDPDALVIAFADHRAVLDNAFSYKRYGLKSDVFHNYIVIMDKGKYIRYKKPFPLYAVPDIILDRLSDGWYCKHFSCKIDSNPEDKRKFLTQYYKIMANGMKKYVEDFTKIDGKCIRFNKIYFYNTSELLFDGFSYKENGFRWSDKKKSQIAFNIKSYIKNKDIYLLIRLGTLGKQDISIYLNGHKIFDKILCTNDTTLRLSIKKGWLDLKNTNKLKFILPNAHLPGNGDKRVLALKFKSLKFQ